MVVYIKHEMQRLLKIDFIRFCLVGGSGFVINIILLTFLTGPVKLSIFWAQLISAEVALFSNFVLHHQWTYKHHEVRKTIHRLLVEFHATTWPAILGSTFLVSTGVHVLHMDKYAALIVSSAVALLWNFSWSKFVVWRDVTVKEAEEPAS
jgi:putative flippase GtrA